MEVWKIESNTKSVFGKWVIFSITYSIKALQSNDFEKQRRKRRFNFCFSKTGKTDAQCITFCIWNYFLSSFLREKKSWKLLYQMKKYMKKTTMKGFTISWFSKSCFPPWIITITSIIIYYWQEIITEFEIVIHEAEARLKSFVTCKFDNYICAD